MRFKIRLSEMKGGWDWQVLCTCGFGNAGHGVHLGASWETIEAIVRGHFSEEMATRLLAEKGVEV